MKILTLPSQKYLAECLSYTQRSGVFVWKHRADMPSAWNGRLCGKVAGQVNARGYRNIVIDEVRYPAHRLAWVYHYGDVLSEQMTLDHIDRNRDHNAIANLRVASNSQNMANRPGYSKRGLPKGIEDRNGRFLARLMVDQVRRSLGTFGTIDEAVKAYNTALHAAHGEYALIIE